MHKSVWEQVPKSSKLKAKPVFLTGVLEQELFWKDIRRVLFSKAQVKTLCRLNYDSIQKSWTPVKLVNILGEVAPKIAEDMNNIGKLTLDAMVFGYNSTHINSTSSRVLTVYSRLLSEKSKIKLTEKDVAIIDSIGSQYDNELGSILESRVAFNLVTGYLSQSYGEKVVSDPEILVDMREVARQETILEGAVQQNDVINKQTSSIVEEAYIDAEVIAIYW